MINIRFIVRMHSMIKRSVMLHADFSRIAESPSLFLTTLGPKVLGTLKRIAGVNNIDLWKL